MLLSARILGNCTTVNNFTYEQQACFTQGDSPDIYFVLVDLGQDRSSDGFNPSGRRYVPAAGATLQVTIQNIDSTKTVTRTATQPFVGDSSIWKISLLSTDPIRGSADIRLALTEGGKVTNGYVKQALAIQSATPSMG